MNFFQVLQAIAYICTIASFACTFFGLTAKDINKPIDLNDRVQPQVIAKK